MLNRYKESRYWISREELYCVIVVMELSLLWIIRSIPHISVVVDWTTFLLTRCQHALQRDAHRDDTEDRRPFVAKDGCADMSI